jgi:tRNA nucleotidyltransferase/poly(A) polymerase
MVPKQIIPGDVPEYIIALMTQIEQAGFSVWIVGGAVRDGLLGRLPIEYDVASSATPDQIQTIFPKTVPTGIAYGTVTVVTEGHNVEVTTFRQESEYKNARHPSNVSFSTNIEEDLARRDFTINAMAYNPMSNQLLDLYNGITHLNKKQLVCVGDPIERFLEDTLRPFRCFRLMAQLGLVVPSETHAALAKSSKEVALPAMERIRQEMDRLLMAPYWTAALTLMERTGWLQKVVEPPPSLSGPNDLPSILLYRWAWLLSNTVDSAHTYLFSKKDIQKMRHILTWEFNQAAIELTVKDLELSATQLMDMGFKGKEIGDIQKDLLEKVRAKEVENNLDKMSEYILKTWKRDAK